MSSSLYLLLSFTLLTQSAIAANFLFREINSAPENLSASFPHWTNQYLNILLDDVNATAPPTAYGSISVTKLYPRPHPPSYTLAVCRGDVNFTTCQACLAEAIIEIRKAGPENKKSGVMSYADCLLEYSDVDFFGKIDNESRYIMWECAGDVGDILVEFKEKRGDFLSQLSEEASVAPKLYAAGELELEGGMKMHGMVQCARDLSCADCKKCLDGILSEIESCLDGMQRARLLGRSCLIDYQIIYPTFASAKAIA
ncbi:hypothetical protein NMG60_11003081 [Bertholletia excelsa]